MINFNRPSRWSQRIYLAIIAMIAGSIALYMGLYQWRVIPSVWDPIFGNGTENVLDSDVSHELLKLIRLPDAVLGAISYYGDIIFSMAGSTQRWKDRPWLVLFFGFYVIPPAFVSFILVLLQATVVGSWCFLCLVSAALSLLLIYFSYNEVAVSCVFLWKVWKKSKKIGLVWATFCGKPTEMSFEITKEIEK